MLDTVPVPIARLFAHFPLVIDPPIPLFSKPLITRPTLWIHPPLKNSLLSTDVECLKWQAYLVTRGLQRIHVRWDISTHGSIDGRLPNLHVPQTSSPGEGDNDNDFNSQGTLLPARSIPGWVDETLGVDSTADPLEGYIDQPARDESRAWVSLLEGPIHAALELSRPPQSFFSSLFYPSAQNTDDVLKRTLAPAPAPLTGLSSLIPSYGIRISPSNIITHYREAMSALSERLGQDAYFLGSKNATPLDALAFAYLNCIASSTETVQYELKRHHNLLIWEKRMRASVSSIFEIDGQ